jgi:ethanolamine permease
VRSAPPPALERVLRPIHLWAIAVGLVVSGDYFGWNYGVGKAGPVGMLVATGAVTLFYVAFIFSYTELSTAIPHSGGPFAYALRAFGPLGGFLAGFGTLVEFAFAPPAIALAIGAYVNFRVPALPKLGVAIAAFLVFGALNVAGVTIAATFELVVTALATLELFIFFGLAGPHVDAARIVTDPLLPHGWGGVFAALPFAIWFYLALEGVAMSAEEVVDPRRDIPKGYIAGIATLVVLALGTLVCSTGILSPEALVEDDSPLPRVLRAILSADHPMTHLMVYLGLFGLIASFHGIIMGCSRQVFALARAGYLPPALAGVHATRRTPVPAILLCVLVGGAAAASERADELIALAGLGATVLYVTSLASLFALRRKEPALERPFKAPLYPALLALAFAGWRLTARGAAAGAPATAPGAPAGAAP